MSSLQSSQCHHTLRASSCKFHQLSSSDPPLMAFCPQIPRCADGSSDSNRPCLAYRAHCAPDRGIRAPSGPMPLSTRLCRDNPHFPPHHSDTLGHDHPLLLTTSTTTTAGFNPSLYSPQLPLTTTDIRPWTYDARSQSLLAALHHQPPTSNWLSDYPTLSATICALSPSGLTPSAVDYSNQHPLQLERSSSLAL